MDFSRASFSLVSVTFDSTTHDDVTWLLALFERNPLGKDSGAGFDVFFDLRLNKRLSKQSCFGLVIFSTVLALLFELKVLVVKYVTSLSTVHCLMAPGLVCENWKPTGVMIPFGTGEGQMMQSKPERSEGFDVINGLAPKVAGQTTPEQPGHYSRYNTKLAKFAIFSRKFVSHSFHWIAVAAILLE